MIRRHVLCLQDTRRCVCVCVCLKNRSTIAKTNLTVALHGMCVRMYVCEYTCTCMCMCMCMCMRKCENVYVCMRTHTCTCMRHYKGCVRLTRASGHDPHVDTAPTSLPKGSFWGIGPVPIKNATANCKATSIKRAAAN